MKIFDIEYFQEGDLMANLTEQLQEESKQKAKDAIKLTAKGVQAASKGIALILNGTVLSEAAIMSALDKKLEQTGDLKYSHANVSIEELQKSGKVEKIDELMLQESMQYFDKYCREYGVKYSALKTTELVDGKEKEGYSVFFEGKNDKLILDIMKNAVSDWKKDQEQLKETGKDVARAAGMGKTSVLAKLAFFRNRIKEPVTPQQEQNKTNVPEKERKQDLER